MVIFLPGTAFISDFIGFGKEFALRFLAVALAADIENLDLPDVL